MNNYEARKRLLHILHGLQWQYRNIQRKRTWTDSEKVMTKASIAQDIEAMEIALIKFPHTGD